MRLNSRIAAWFIIGITLGALARDASAVIKVEMPISKRFNEGSRSVIIGKVASINLELRLVEVTTVQSLKPGPTPPTVRLQFVNPPELINSIVVGQPVVMFTKIAGSVHIADTWLSASAVAGKDPPIWRITQIDRQARNSFPGTTAALVRVLEEVKEGKSTLLDNFDNKIFTGGAKEIAKLDVTKATSLISIDVNGDGKPDLIVTSPQGVKLFLAAGEGYIDATTKWGLAGVTGAAIATADVNADGKPDLLIDKTIYLNDGQKFTAGPVLPIDGAATVLASSLGNFTGGGKVDAALLLTDGRLLVYKNGGAAWAKEVDRKLIASGTPQAAVFGDFAGDGKATVVIAMEKDLLRFNVAGESPANDFARLTGDALDRIKGFDNGLKSASLTRIDVNGDHRPELLISVNGATLVLVNRGFGTFLPDPEAAVDFNSGGKILPFAISEARARVAVSAGAEGPEDLLVLSHEGKLFLVKNPVTKAK